MDFYFSQIIEGIVSGTTYGLLGLAMMFVYRTGRVFNFAQGEMATASAFVAVVLLKYLPGPLAIPLVLIGSFVAGALIDMLVLRLPAERNQSTLIISIGLLSVIHSINAWIFGYEPYSFPSPFPEGGLNLHGAFISYQNVGVFCSAMGVAILLFFLFRFTRIGLAFQAMSEDPTEARLKGVRTDLLISFAWGISAVIGAIAGMLISNSLFLHPGTMATVLLYAYAAATIGGLQSSFGALVGGVIVGILENLFGTLPGIGSELKAVAVFGVLVFFLIVKPRGLFGRDDPRKI